MTPIVGSDVANETAAATSAPRAERVTGTRSGRSRAVSLETPGLTASPDALSDERIERSFTDVTYQCLPSASPRNAARTVAATSRYASLDFQCSI
jgi:hypothetical protein